MTEYFFILNLSWIRENETFEHSFSGLYSQKFNHTNKEVFESILKSCKKDYQAPEKTAIRFYYVVENKKVQK